MGDIVGLLSFRSGPFYYRSLIHPDILYPSLIIFIPEDGFEQDRFQDGVQLFKHVLEKDRVAKLDTVFQGPHVVRVRQFDNLVWGGS